MHIELSQKDAEILRDVLRERILELDKEINRTDSHSYKAGLQELDRVLERVVGTISAAIGKSERG